MELLIGIVLLALAGVIGRLLAELESKVVEVPLLFGGVFASLGGLLLTMGGIGEVVSTLLIGR